MLCTRCGKPNDDDARFCKHCGAPLGGTVPPAAPPTAPPAAPPTAPPAEPTAAPPTAPPPPPYYGRRPQDDCDRECQGRSHDLSWFWGIILVFIGLSIIFSLAVPNIDWSGLHDWARHFDLWWVIPLIIGLLIISIGVKMVLDRGRPK